MNAHEPPTQFLPQSTEAEECLLGTVMMFNDAYLPASEIVEAEHFAEPLRGRLWEMIGERLNTGQLVSPITLGAALGPDSKADIGGGMGMTIRQYIAHMCANAGTIKVAPNYAALVREMWERRQLVALSHEIQERAVGGLNGGSISELIEEAETALSHIRFGKELGFVTWLGDAATDAVNETNAAFRDERRPGFNSGLACLDELIGAFMPGHFVTLLGASGNGKSALAAQIAYNVARPNLFAPGGTPVAFISQEMQATELARRALAQDTGLSTRAQVNGDVVPAEYEALDRAARDLRKIPMLIDGSGRQKVSKIIKKLQAMRKRYGVRLAVVDHILLLLPEHPRQTKIETIEQGAYALKDAAKEMDMCIIALAQLTREGQKHAPTWRPRDQDLYGGDMVKQACDAMLGIAIPGEWLRQREPDRADEKAYGKWAADCLKWEGLAEIGALKVRDGQSGGWRAIGWDGPRVRFTER